MKQFTPFFLIAMLHLATMKAQEFVQVAVGASYSQQAFYTLSNNEKTVLANESWDLAFGTAAQGAAIFYNEAAKASFTGEAPQLSLYLAPTNNFADEVNLSLITDTLYNPEIDWDNGAFNSIKNENDPDDYGWGAFDTGTQSILGNKVYALQLRNGTWKKIFIESMANGIFTMKYANLDGTGENTVTINKADYSGSPLAFFSFTSGTATASPSGWDLLFTRYRTPLDPGDGEVIQYMVTGVLSAPGVEVAEARNIDPETVDYTLYLDSLGSQLDIIGQDWKFFDLGASMWIVDLSRAYFVKTAGNHLWKLVFYTFDGSSTGNFTFEKTDLGPLSGVESPVSNFIDFGLFPNPATTEMTISFSLEESQKDLYIYLSNSLGQPVWQSRVQGNTGLNILEVHPKGLPAGIYTLTLGKGRDTVTTKVVIR
ncbi:MAG: T9SS type A sorting domain-containing protein [Phaeodactylibacter sp.]|nr:T9SS type A sorting domain-containing protein [Phaeodactylibacter sp.]MCB9050183.1 T9SS type A sorting domain-containing protein [Lewinellaceae bacterium]